MEFYVECMILAMFFVMCFLLFYTNILKPVRDSKKNSVKNVSADEVQGLQSLQNIRTAKEQRSEAVRLKNRQIQELNFLRYDGSANGQIPLIIEDEETEI